MVVRVPSTWGAIAITNVATSFDTTGSADTSDQALDEKERDSIRKQLFSDYAASQSWATISTKQFQVLFPTEEIVRFRENSSYNDSSDNYYHLSFFVQGLGIPYSFNLRIKEKWYSEREVSGAPIYTDSLFFSVCWGSGMLPSKCSGEGLSVKRIDGGFVMTLSDTSLIASIFTLRPKSATMRYDLPKHMNLLAPVPLEYVDPQIPMPQPADFRAADSTAEYFRIRATHGFRHITGEDRRNVTHVAMGDSVLLRVHETLCHHDICISKPTAILASGWIVKDSSIITLHPFSHKSVLDSLTDPSSGMDRRYAVAKRIGKTRITVQGLRSKLDTVKMANTLNDSIEVTISVVPRPARIHFELENLPANKDSILVKTTVYDTSGIQPIP